MVLSQKNRLQRVVIFLIIFNNIIYIEIIPNKISILYDESKTLNLNIYEIKIDDNLIHNKSLINNFLYECQCALFLADITNKESFELIQKLISNIEMDKYPYLKKILIQSKYDQESNRKVSNLEFKEYLDVNKSIDGIEISSKDGTKIKELINIINNAVNESKNELPLNIVSEAQQKVKTLFNIVGSFSIVLIGDSTVGKTCFLNRYFKNQFSTTLSNIGIDTDIKFIKLGNDEYKLTVWDTVGQERFRALPKKYFQNADGVLLLFDVTKEESFNNVSNWIKDVKDNSNNQNGVVIYIIGNKIDLPERVIDKEKAEEFAKSLGMKYFEISCKLNMNIQEVMARMIVDCHMKTNGIKDIKDCFTLKSAKKGNKDKKGCCH